MDATQDEVLVRQILLQRTFVPAGPAVRAGAAGVVAAVMLWWGAHPGWTVAWLVTDVVVAVGALAAAAAVRRGRLPIERWPSVLVVRSVVGNVLLALAPLLVPAGERGLHAWSFVLWVVAVLAILSTPLAAGAVRSVTSSTAAFAVVFTAGLVAGGGDASAADRAVLAGSAVVGAAVSAVIQSQLHRRMRDGAVLRHRNEALARDLAARAQLASTVFETAAAAIFTVDPEGVIRMANPAAAALVGGEPEDLVGARMSDVLPESGPGLSGEVDLCRRNGTRVRVHADVRDLPDGIDGASYVVTARELVDRRSVEARLRYQATHDELTGLPNRVSLLARAERAAASARRNVSGYGLVCIDLIDLPTIEQKLGRRRADELLQLVAERLSGAVRASDTVARLGDHEFVLLVEDVPSAMETTRLAGRLLGALADPVEIGGEAVRVVASVGVAYSEGGSSGPEDLLREADEALAHSRLGGAGRVTLLDEGQQSFVDEQQRLETEIRDAIAGDHMELWAQPIVRLDDEQPVAVELLVRWMRDGSPVSPALFVPVAEQSDLILDLDRMVIRRALALLDRWSSVPECQHLTVGINISGRHLTNADLAADIEELLAAHPNVDPRRLLVEITETHVGADPATTTRQLVAVRGLGPQVAIDDFGTGYASLTALQAVPATELKVDRSFVALLDGADPDEQYRAASIVQACTNLAQAFGLVVVAEGIETEAQQQLAYDLGCALGQGYAFCRPLPMEEAEAWLRARVALTA